MGNMSKIGREEISAGKADLTFGVLAPKKKRDIDCIDFSYSRFNLLVVALSIYDGYQR